jgi:hypothetical protein
MVSSEQSVPRLGSLLPTSVPALGRLTSVDPRGVWINEARDLTPWLLANADHLANALGIELELTASEHPVGGFNLDLVGRDLTHDSILMVENQLEGSDHSHLGQLLTYAAGTGAATIVWVATNFREEHRQALDWLNEHTDPDIRLFGIQLEVVKIGESLPAPVLHVVSQPNDWQKRVRSATAGARAGGKSALYLDFWTRFLERIHREHPTWTRARKPSTANWLWVTHPIRGVPLAVSFQAGGLLSVELYIDTPDADYNLRLFQSLQSHHEAFEGAFGRRLIWEDQPGRRYCRVADRTQGDVAETERHDELIDWIFDSMSRWRQAVAQAPRHLLDVLGPNPNATSAPGHEAAEGTDPNVQDSDSEP